MSRGLWVVFEGADGVGKTTMMAAVHDRLTQILPAGTDVRKTKHPGSTPLGQHIRTLIKEPQRYGLCETDIDGLSAQMLMYTDHINFRNLILDPLLDDGAIVLADRCDLISGLIYGQATGVTKSQLNALMVLSCSTKIDKLFVLTCPFEVQNQRLAARSGADRFEQIEIRKSVNRSYDRLLTDKTDLTLTLNKIVNLEDVHYVNTASAAYAEKVAAVAGEIKDAYLARRDD